MTRLICLLIILLCTAFGTLFAQQNWTFLDGSVQRTGYVQTDMAPPFELEKQIVFNENIEDFTFQDGVIYFVFTRQGGNGTGAFDMDTEQILWTRILPGTRGSVGTIPVISGDIAYVGAQNGLGLYALDKSTGDSLWLYPAGSLFGRNPSIYGDRLFLHPGFEGVVCLDRMTGDKLWAFGEYGGQTVPTLDEDYVYFNTRLNDTIYALTHDGEVVWKYLSPFEIDDFESMMSKGDTFFIKTRGNIAALNRHTGEEFWSTVLPSNNSFISGNNALTWSPNHIINQEWIGDWSDSFKMQGLDLKTGQLNWSLPIQPAYGNPATAFGDYLVQSNGGTLEVRSSVDGQLIQSLPGYNLDRYYRIKVLDGQILARSSQGVAVFKPRPSGLTGPSELPFNWSIIGNPTNDKLQLSIQANKTLEMQYRLLPVHGAGTSLAGKLWRDRDDVYSIDISGLTSGMYFVQLCQGLNCDQKPLVVTR